MLIAENLKAQESGTRKQTRPSGGEHTASALPAGGSQLVLSPQLR